MSKIRILCIICSLISANLSSHLSAQQMEHAKKVVYSEQEFIHAFDGKSRSDVQKVLGKPNKKAIATRPTGADKYTEKAGDTSHKKDSIEMWYYGKIVKFNDKRIYKLVELTFANDKCVNFSFAF